jgi:hypothetical protein
VTWENNGNFKKTQGSTVTSGIPSARCLSMSWTWTEDLSVQALSVVHRYRPPQERLLLYSKRRNNCVPHPLNNYRTTM